MDTEAVKRCPCNHAGVVVFDDEHIVFGESCSQLRRPGFGDGNTAWVVGPRLHDGDGWASVERCRDGSDNWAFGIDRNAADRPLNAAAISSGTPTNEPTAATREASFGGTNPPGGRLRPFLLGMAQCASQIARRSRSSALLFSA